MQNTSKQLQRWATLVVLAVLASATVTNALKCYACSYQEGAGNSDTNCEKNVSALRVINCSKKYCTIVRLEALHNASKVISFLRDCQDQPLLLNGVRTDTSFRTYYRSCQHDLCNNHDGRSSGSGNNSSSGNHNGIVPGKSIACRPWCCCCSHSWALAVAVAAILAVHLASTRQTYSC